MFLFSWQWLCCGGLCFCAKNPDAKKLTLPLHRAARTIRRHRPDLAEEAAASLGQDSSSSVVQQMGPLLVPHTRVILPTTDKHSTPEKHAEVERLDIPTHNARDNPEHSIIT